MTIILGFLMIYITIISGSMFISSILNKKIETTIAINIGIIILALYLFGAFNLLLQGLYIIVAINIILGIIAIIIKKKKILDLVFTPGFTFFSIMYFILMITNFNKALTHWDQFSYRSLNVKMMFYNNSMMAEYARIYQPATTLIEYFFMKMIGVYIQGIEAFAMQIFGIALLLPMYENVKENKLAKIVIGLTILFLPAVFTNLVFYQSSYPDATLGLLLGYILYTYFTENNIKYKTIAIAIATAVLVLTKPSGIAITLIMIAILIIYEILKNKYYKKENIKKIISNENIKVIAVIIISAILIFISWKIVLKVYTKSSVRTDQSRVGESSINYIENSLLTTIFGKYEDNNDAANSNGSLIPTIYKVKGFTFPVQMSLAITSIVISIGYIWYYYKTKNSNLKYQTIVVIIGLILYVGFLQLSYLLKFVTFEMLGHNGIDRYFPTYLLGMLYLLIAIVIRNLSKKEYIAKDYIIIMAIMLLITPIQSVCEATITSGIYNINSQEQVNYAKNRADAIDKYVEDNSKIITISQKKEEESYNIMLRYYLYPNHQVNILSNLEIEKEETLKNIINSKEYQYIYVFWKDENLEGMFENIFNNDYELKDETLYKIEYIDEHNIRLIEQIYIDENTY